MASNKAKERQSKEMPLLGIQTQSYDSYQNENHDQHTNSTTTSSKGSKQRNSNSNSSTSNSMNYPASVYHSPTAGLRQPLLSQVINMDRDAADDLLLSDEEKDTKDSATAAAAA